MDQKLYWIFYNYFLIEYSQYPCINCVVIISIVQVERLRAREFKKISQSYTANNWYKSVII